ncbi:MAG: carbohydrate-binding protein [Syntrophothermus sp.]
MVFGFLKSRPAKGKARHSAKADNGGSSSVHAGEKITVKYNGPLAQNGAGQVYLHAGYGQDWENLQDIAMEKSEDGWTAELEVDTGDRLNFCFTDGEHWDNNQGNNWSYEIHNGIS